MLMSWGDMSVGQASSSRSSIKWLIGDDLGWGHKLGPVADSWNIWCTALLVHTFWYFIWCFIYIFKTIMMTFKLMRQNQRWIWHVNVCYISQGSIKTPFKGDRWLLCHFVTHLLGYMCTNTYSNRERFNKVIAETKWCTCMGLSALLEVCSRQGPIQIYVYLTYMYPTQYTYYLSTVCYIRFCKRRVSTLHIPAFKSKK